MKRFKRPFTLVELLCVIIVLAMLAAIALKATQIAYRRADETKTQAILEIIRNANEQYKTKNGYYYPNGGSDYETVTIDGKDYKFHSIKLDAEFLGEAYENCRTIAAEGGGSTDKIRDAWGNAIRYRSPGAYNVGSFDVYSIGRDKGVGDAEDKNKQFPGLGDDIANFKNPLDK